MPSPPAMKRQRARVSCSAADVEQRDEAARGAAMSATIGGDRTRVAMAGGGHRRWPRAHGAVPRSGSRRYGAGGRGQGVRDDARPEEEEEGARREEEEEERPQPPRR